MPSYAPLSRRARQGTDAMYNFVLKVNLATSEGKERFMRRWAVGRLAEGQQPTPREGWKFLESLGIDVANKKVNKVSSGCCFVHRGDVGLSLARCLGAREKPVTLA